MKVIKLVSISLIIVLFNISSISYAFEKNDSYDEILTSYKYDESYVKDLKTYLTSKSFNSEEYDKIISLLNKFKDSKVEKFWLIETGRLLFDDVIFQHIDVKPIYQKNLTKNNNDIKKASIDTKKDIIRIIDDLYYMYEETFNIIPIDGIKPPIDSEGFEFDEELVKKENERKLTIIRNSFKNQFNRMPSQEEEAWLSDMKTIKYALYSGYLNRTLSKDDIKMIDDSKGYELLQITKAEYMEFKSYIDMHQKIEELEEEYIKTRYKLTNVRAKILKEHNVDIYKSLLDYERYNVYLIATQDIVFNESKAYDYAILLLKDKGLLDSSSDNNTNNPPSDNDSNNNSNNGSNNGSNNNSNNSTSPNKPGIEQNFTNNNFFDDLLEFKDNLKNNKLHQIITQAAKFLYTVKSQDKTGNYLFIKINNVEFETGIFIDKDKNMTKSMLNEVFYLIKNKIDLKTVVSKEKVLVQGNNNIIFESKKNIFENEKGKFDNIKKLLNKLNIDIYTKYVLLDNNKSN